MTHLYLIRHGEADGLKPNQPWYTFPNPGLSKLGIRQAERLRDRLAATGEIRADALVSSTLQRAKETAQIIAPALGLPIIFDDEVQEFNMGEAEGLSAAEIKERFGQTDVWAEPFRRIAPGGESWAEFLMRACRGLDRLTRDYAGKTLVIVCHGGVIETSFIAFLGLSMLRQAIFVAAQNTSITHWQKDTFEGQAEKWCLRRVNDYAHLLDLDTNQRIPWEAFAVKPEQAPAAAPGTPEQ